MTIEQFRNYKGCENYGDEESAGIIESLRTLARILTSVKVATGTAKQESNNNNNHKVNPHLSKVKPIKHAA